MSTARVSGGEFDFEPVPGLPENLPQGETILWQGAPEWRRLARSAFHVRGISIYFGILALWGASTAAAETGSALAAMTSALWVLIPAAVTVGLLALLAYASARTTIYTITNRRIVMRYGVALPMTVNLPFPKIAAAGRKLNSDGTGDITVQLAGPDHLAWLHLWPHVRPWRLKTPEPMIRSIPDAQKVTDILAEALIAAMPATQATADKTVANSPASTGMGAGVGTPSRPHQLTSGKSHARPQISAVAAHG